MIIGLLNRLFPLENGHKPRGKRHGGRRRGAGLRALRILAALLLTLGGLGLGMAGGQAPGTGPVYVAEIDGEIDLGIAPYLERIIGQAEQERAAALVLRINTPGGRLDAALRMKNALLDSQVPTIAFVNREAFSAGALIAIATERVYMVPGAVMGAATPVTGTGETADEKIISAVRSSFRSVAETRGLDPQIAEAMVDPRIEVPGLVDSGSLLTLTTQEALEWEYAVASVANLEELLEAEDLGGRQVIETSPGFAEALVRFITNPIVASLLITIGFLGILFELQSPGFGIGGAIGILALLTFFGGHLVAGLAGWEGVALVVLGLALLALEIFVIPGFGIAGILGAIAFLAGIYISLIGDLPTAPDYNQALLVVGVSLLLMIIGTFLSLRFLPKRSLGGLILESRLPAHQRPRTSSGAAEPERTEIVISMEGMRGAAITDLHPAGAAEIAGRRVDVVAEEGFLRTGTRVEVIQDDGYRKVVRAVRPEEESAATGTETSTEG